MGRWFTAVFRLVGVGAAEGEIIAPDFFVGVVEVEAEEVAVVGGDLIGWGLAV